jgi:hypothetical protein
LAALFRESGILLSWGLDFLGDKLEDIPGLPIDPSKFDDEADEDGQGFVFGVLWDTSSSLAPTSQASS